MAFTDHLQQQSAESSPSAPITALASTSDSLTLSLDSLSVIHTATLLNSNVSADDALTNFKTDIFPWKSPTMYIDAETNHVNTVLQEIRILTGKVEMEKASFGEPMIYSVS